MLGPKHLGCRMKGVGLRVLHVSAVESSPGLWITAFRQSGIAGIAIGTACMSDRLREPQLPRYPVLRLKVKILPEPLALRYFNVLG